MSMTPDAYRTETLSVGGMFHLRTRKDWIAYAGMVNEDTFSIVQIKASGNRGYGWNLYFPRRAQDITIDGVPLSVIRADSNSIEFRAAR